MIGCGTSQTDYSHACCPIFTFYNIHVYIYVYWSHMTHIVVSEKLLMFVSGKVRPSFTAVALQHLHPEMEEVLPRSELYHHVKFC